MINEKTREKMRQSALARKEKGTQASGWKLTDEQRRKHTMFGDKNPSKRADVREKMRLKRLGKKLSKETIKRIMDTKRKKYIGKLMSEDGLKRLKEKVSKSQKEKVKNGTIKVPNTKGKPRLSIRGEKHYYWKGGITPINEKIRRSLEYRLWRESIFIRDEYTCRWCGSKNGNGKTIILNAHHIKPFADYPELRFAIDNGLTLCKECHKTTFTKILNN